MTYFERDYLKEVGTLIDDVMTRWVAENDVVLFIFTPKVTTSGGVQRELSIAREMGKPTISIMREDVPRKTQAQLMALLDEYIGDVVVIPFAERTLGEMLIKANLEGRLQELVRS